MEILINFLVSIAASVVVNYVDKWLGRRRKGR
jgi:hypothetical protein